MQTASARIWRESNRWAVQIEIDGAQYTQRDYSDIVGAAQAIASILRQQADRADDLDQVECSDCEEPLDLLTCSQCGVDAFVRTCDHDGAPPIHATDDALFCRRCRP